MYISQSLLYLPIVLAIAIIGGFAFTKRSAKGLLYFSLMSFTLALWLGWQALAQLNISNDANIYFIRLSTATSFFIGYFFLMFILDFIGSKTKRYTSILLLLPCIIMAIVNLTTLGVSNVVITPLGISVNDANTPYLAGVLMTAIYIVVGLTLLVINTLHKEKNQRSANYLIIIAFAQAVAIIVTGSIFLAENATLQFIIPISVLLLVVIITYAIIRHRLFDIRLVAVRALTYLLSVGLLATVYSIVAFRIASIFIDSWPIAWRDAFYVFLAVVLALTFAPLKRFFERLTSSIFYRNRYDATEFINTIGKITASEIELAKLTHDTRAEIVKQMKLSKAEIVILAKDDVYYQNQIFKDKNGAIDKKELQSLGSSLVLAEDQTQQASKVMKKYDINISIPLKSQGKVLGYLLLGDKKSGDVYSTQDLQVLTTIGSELSVAVQNALSYKEIQLFSETLAQKVRERTKQLNDANHQLRILDEAKDEFISMASHQLRTPLTTVKGYASMLQEGDFGHLSDKQKEPVKQALDGANRMARLIDDLLNVSRMDANRFYLEVSEVDVKALVREELEQLQSLARAKNVVITYHELKDNIRKIRIDENKTRQVIMNLVDNAIHYSQKAEGGGKIHVSLTKNPHELIFMVQDNGIGVPKAMQHRLFTKMFRADNARELRPDGTGLGLYLVKRVVQDQGGKIIFESKPGSGSTFGFTLPFSGVPKSVEAKSKQIGARVANTQK